MHLRLCRIRRVLRWQRAAYLCFDDPKNGLTPLKVADCAGASIRRFHSCTQTGDHHCSDEGHQRQGHQDFNEREAAISIEVVPNAKHRSVVEEKRLSNRFERRDTSQSSTTAVLIVPAIRASVLSGRRTAH